VGSKVRLGKRVQSGPRLQRTASAPRGLGSRPKSSRCPMSPKRKKEKGRRGCGRGSHTPIESWMSRHSASGWQGSGANQTDPTPGPSTRAPAPPFPGLSRAVTQSRLSVHFPDSHAAGAAGAVAERSRTSRPSCERCTCTALALARAPTSGSTYRSTYRRARRTTGRAAHSPMPGQVPLWELLMAFCFGCLS